MLPGVYRHYKGNLYRLLFVAKDSGNNSPTQNEDIAVYVSLYESGRISTRPMSEFLETVIDPNTNSPVARFTPVGD